MEPRFTELYVVLGNKDEQDRIRDQYPGELHCPMLRQDANACTGCKNNPHSTGRQHATERLEEYSVYLRRARRLHVLAKFGLLDPAKLGAIDMELLLAIDDEIEQRRMKAQAMHIAEAVAALFGGN